MNPTDAEITNTLGMRLRRIEPGSFLMGNDKSLPDALIVTPSCFRRGDFDEQPVHRVAIGNPYYMASCQVTNAQYEAFDPAHRDLRGKLGFSKADDEAVVFVSWSDAVGFCEWLSKKENIDYRLPTEAEWEYACRADTSGVFHTGDQLPDAFHKNVGRTWFPDPSRTESYDPVSLKVGSTPPNPWGLFDMHGNVEEWCLDWYGRYGAAEQTDPVGPSKGDFRVTRGGSHSTELYYLRAANRAGTLPAERNWLIGFRVVMDPRLVTESGTLTAHVVVNSVDDRQTRAVSPKPETSSFTGPVRYVHIPPNSHGPLFSAHNHDPAICECPNGDILAIWYSCVEEKGRELAVVTSRLRNDSSEWEPASPFWDAPDRNNHAPALWCNGSRIFHFNGLSASATWGPLVTILRTSDDSGASWSSASIIIPEHGPRHMPVASVFSLSDGTIVLPCDAVSVGAGGTALWLSEDSGESWRDAGGTIAGIHASAAELIDGSLLGFGRGDDIDGHMPMSISRDRGTTWEYSPSIFPPISSGQRLVLKRIVGECEAGSNPLLFVSFGNELPESSEEPEAFVVAGTGDAVIPAVGMYCALSFDQGATWPFRRHVSDDLPERNIETMDGRPASIGPASAENMGYLSAWQATDGTVHLISSTNHYTFNLAWLSARCVLT